MKYIQKYDKQFSQTLGDYVICKSTIIPNKILEYENITEPFDKIGKIKSFDGECFIVIYNDDEHPYVNYVHYALEDEIVYHSNNLEDMILYLNAMQYNL